MSVRQANEAPPQDDELLTALSPLLDEVDGLRGDEAPQEADNIPVLLEENARLRKLAVKLSNLLGDLPERGHREVEAAAIARAFSRYTQRSRSDR